MAEPLRSGPEGLLTRPMRALQESARTVSSVLAKMGGDEHTQLLLLAVAIGVAAGGAVLVFYKAIDAIQELVLRSALRTDLPALFLIPTFVALGLVACRALVRWGAKDSPGENIPDVMYRVTVKGGVIRSLPVVVKALGAAIVIGTGGSVGAEGPVVVLGAAADAAARAGASSWVTKNPNARGRSTVASAPNRSGSVSSRAAALSGPSSALVRVTLARAPAGS